MLKLSVTPKAESDLIGIWVYTCEKWGADQADKYLDQLESGMKPLINHPSLGANYVSG
ncbi:type II toxin-antitoxin system RelE/ParE family toxin [Salinivibrio kushneri]|uniref:type II toxin-antitoxin system RelE/ParE family toxin n=1 Tax=Salinivibrio kushneri TaxID=1908198 RepID=UPI0022B3CE33|nr:type II toxin-antitoxin system RelE/ParE family toxin [Salinivibrio kushneri]WBA17095.1 type II toxin-antitoxin system RelE/ParE family toxin [Salinivibrio kushneri]